MHSPATQKRRFLGISEAAANRLVQAAKNQNPVSGFTHNFYRYPARFSPALVRAAISAFSRPGDVVLDPFVGGGTTLVEALAAGRQAIGIDISELATFVSEVKTKIYTAGDLKSLLNWGEEVSESIDMHATFDAPSAHKTYEEDGYLRHLDGVQTWRLRKAVVQALDSASRLKGESREKFARCAILRTAQWALDGRKVLPLVEEFRQRLRANVQEMATGSAELAAAVSKFETASAKCVRRSTSGLETDPAFLKKPRPRLVVTSPPYPGVHVLYHRWQVHGGKETPAPFWIANRLDGDGAAYYTMGDRKSHAAGKYFDELRASLRSVAAVCDKKTTVVQVVAFSDPDVQLPRYLSVVDDVGLEECFLPGSNGLSVARRLWRSVPNRKWYASQKGQTGGSYEVVLFHKLRS
jgi:DNA methylase